MQHIKFWLRRSVPLVLICCVFLFVLSPSASAEKWAYLGNTTVTDGAPAISVVNGKIIVTGDPIKIGFFYLGKEKIEGAAKLSWDTLVSMGKSNGNDAVNGSAGYQVFTDMQNLPTLTTPGFYVFFANYLNNSGNTVSIYSEMMVSAPADEWTDFKYTTVKEDGNITYTLDLTSNGRMYWYTVYPYEVHAYSPGTQVYFDGGERYGFYYQTVSIDVDSLFLSSSVTSFDVIFSLADTGIEDIINGYVEIHYLDSSGSRISYEHIPAQWSGDDSGGSGLMVASFSPSVPSGCSSVYFVCSEEFTLFDPTYVTFSLSSFDYSFTVPASSAENMEIKDKLDQLGDQQNQTNEKLDDIINGEVSPDPPAGSGLIDDLDQAEGALRDEAQSGLNNALDQFQHSSDSIYYYAQAFAVVANLFGYLTDLPFFSGLLDISLSLGVLCVILNLGEMATRVSGARSRRFGKTKKGG